MEMCIRDRLHSLNSRRCAAEIGQRATAQSKFRYKRAQNRTLLIGLYHKIGHGPGRLLLAFGQFTLKLDFVMPLTERLFNTRCGARAFSISWAAWLWPCRFCTAKTRDLPTRQKNAATCALFVVFAPCTALCTVIEYFYHGQTRPYRQLE